MASPTVAASSSRAGPTDILTAAPSPASPPRRLASAPPAVDASGSFSPDSAVDAPHFLFFSFLFCPGACLMWRGVWLCIARCSRAGARSTGFCSGCRLTRFSCKILTALSKKIFFFGAKFGTCQEVQKLRLYKNRRLMIQTSQSIGDAPYGDHFTVEGIWDLEQDSLDENCCDLRIYTNVAFSKKTIFRGKIEENHVK
ncbi:hypothetical protein BDA96_03G191800 [Sorghum bicolor]|uniref:VASt domain-containing protein n=2 Tax=Sorghum bicolor TaxID=4558 RepID=A0A921RCJ7_SORBI|nr:uncharacterized protein LOC8075418 isoform X2 [Sorghum bicolor]KAG0537938.1 hypothetical protein BDA96_03G191800 [Sorghum bicolor]KXG32633.1 hypothetical protein SORBI_3003G176600 [Sorghum bicolor]|eukprot:XP_021313507.1 uncharacterized protein LOC8075418 isoform X2 [Sorghum bicolor]